MKKRLLSLTLVMAMIFTQISFISVFAETTADTTTQTPIESAFTDANFLNAVRKVIGKTNGEHIYPSDVENIEKLKVVNKNIVSLDGIEYFTGLKKLYCYDNNIVNLDLSSNVNLEYLDCSYNMDMETLNVTNNIALKELECNYTTLERLDVSKNINLTRLIGYSSWLRTLNVSNNTMLEELDIYDAKLPNIDVSKNDKLTYLDCSYNYMNSVDDVIGSENCTLLDEVIFEPQQNTEPITELFDENFLEVVREKTGKSTDDEIYQADVDSITELTMNNASLTNLDGIEHFKSLEKLDCMTNEIENIDLYSNKNLVEVDCTENKLTTLDFSGNANLEKVTVVSNDLTDINVSNNPELTNINVIDNELTSLNLSNNSALQSVKCSDNSMKSINNVSLPTACSAEVGFYPQSAPVLDIAITNTGNALISNGKGTPNSVIKIYDLYNCDLSKVPAELLEDKTLLVYDEETADEEEGEDFTGHKAAIDTLLTNAVELGKFNIEKRKKEFTDKIINNTPITSLSANKLLAVNYIINGTQIVSAMVVDVNNPGDICVESFTYNNNYNNSGETDLLNYGATPIVHTHGYWSHGSKRSIFTIKIDGAENISNLYLVMQREVGNHNMEWEFVKKPNTTNEYYVNQLISGSEGDSWETMDKSLGEMKVLYTTKDDPNEKKDLYLRTIRIVLDPSGYIYEGVPSNRLSNVKTTLYNKNSKGEVIEWEAKEYCQSNPVFTDKEGYFEWFVPAGFWQVKAELDGYENYYTDWMRVPPERKDVNFGMISLEKPVINELFAYPDMVEMNFNKYVYTEDITTDNVTVYSNGEKINGSLLLINPEVDYWEGIYDTTVSGGTENSYVSKIRFIPDESLEVGDNIQVYVNSEVRSYAGVNVDANYEKDATIDVRPNRISMASDNIPGAGGNYAIYYGYPTDIEVQILPIEASKGKTLKLTTDSPWTVAIPNEVTVNENGVAIIPMEGILPESATIDMLLEGSSLTRQIDIDVIVAE